MTVPPGGRNKEESIVLGLGEAKLRVAKPLHLWSISYSPGLIARGGFAVLHITSVDSARERREGFA